MNTPTTPPTPDLPDVPHTPDTPDLPDVPHTSDAPQAAGTLADQVFVDTDRTAPIPTWAPTPPTATSGATATATATAPAPARAPASTAPPEPEWIKGPAPFALVLGLLGLVVAGSTLVAELTDVTLPWNDLGPWSVVAAGIVVLIVGAIGLRSSRSRG